MSGIGYFPGCSLSGSAPEYDRSVRAVAGALACELTEIPEWLCCGASSAHSLDRHAALCLAADTLAKAARSGLSQVLAPCAMCYQRLATAVHEMKEDPALARRIAQGLDAPADRPLTSIKPLNLLHWMASLPAESIKSRVSRALSNVKVACYYGCLLLRPPAVTGALNAEAPREMEKLVEVLGAVPVRWSMAMECCGGSFALTRKSVVLHQGRRIFDAARKAGADVVCLACPMCHNNLDMRQAEYARDTDGALPMVYLTQLVGLAMGIDAEQLGLGQHFVPTDSVLEKA